MRRTRKILLEVLTAAGLLLGSGTATAAATAASGAVAAQPQSLNSLTCNATSGNLVGSYHNKNWAELDLYWDGAHGTNCAYLRHRADAPAGKIRTVVYLWTCQSDTPGAHCTPRGDYGSRYADKDEGSFYDYAGKVKVDGRNHCIYAYGGIDANGDGDVDKWIDSNNKKNVGAEPIGGHCG